MKYKKTIVNFSVLFLSIGGLSAQENTVTAGGEATGSGGSASFTTGQIVYTEKIGTGGSESQGVQQPYEVTATTSLNETDIDIAINVYPNPTTSYLTIDIVSEQTEKLSYQLIDVQGRVIKTKTITTNNTNINVEALTRSTYFLKIIENNKSIKTFNIIKK